MIPWWSLQTPCKLQHFWTNLSLQQEPVLGHFQSIFSLQENLRRTQVAFTGWLQILHVNVVKLLQDQRLPWQFLFLRDIFPQHRIDLDSDCHWLEALLWSSPCCSSGRNPHFPPTLELKTDCSVWEWHEMWYLADGSGLFVLPASSPFLFHFMFPFLHPAVLSFSCETTCACALLWRALCKVIREKLCCKV